MGQGAELVKTSLLRKFLPFRAIEDYVGLTFVDLFFGCVKFRQTKVVGFFLKIKAFALLGSIILLNLNITELITTCELGVHYIGLLTTFSKSFCLSESKSVCERGNKKNCWYLPFCPDL
jgi:hypothetical protein